MPLKPRLENSYLTIHILHPSLYPERLSSSTGAPRHHTTERKEKKGWNSTLQRMDSENCNQITPQTASPLANRSSRTRAGSSADKPRRGIWVLFTIYSLIIFGVGMVLGSLVKPITGKRPPVLRRIPFYCLLPFPLLELLSLLLISYAFPQPQLPRFPKTGASHLLRI